MPLPGVTKTIKDTPGYRYPSREEIEQAEKENGEYLKGRFKVDIEKTDRIDQNTLTLWAVEKKIEDILSHPEYTHLQLWNELKFVYTHLLEKDIEEIGKK